MNLKIFNTLSKKLESFIPLNETIKVYACGPTVYNYPHIGNARPAIIGDILIRILRNFFKKVVYVRNITDIDDKINTKAKEENVSPEFIKPDTHINDIAQGLGITRSSRNYQIFKDVEAYCARINVTPYAVDKVFWLVGSGNFYLSGIKVNSSKHDFISSIKG